MYCYSSEREKLFTDQGQRLFLGIRDHVRRLLREAGAVRMQEAISGFSGDGWTLLAAVDRLVELGELREIEQGDVPRQFCLFVRQGEL